MPTSGIKRRWSNSDGNDRKHHKFEGKKDHVKGFLDFISSLKAMLKETGHAVDSDVYSALISRLLSLFNYQRFCSLSLEQVCSRNIEYMLKFTIDYTVKHLDDKQAVSATVNLWKYILSYLPQGKYIELSKNQYASYTVEHIMSGLINLIRNSSQIATTAHLDILEHFDAVIANILSETFTFENDKFWDALFDNKSTHALRKLTEVTGELEKQFKARDVDVDCGGAVDSIENGGPQNIRQERQRTSKSECFLKGFLRNLLMQDSQRLQNHAYGHESASPTVQAFVSFLATDPIEEVEIRPFLLKRLGDGVTLDKRWLDRLIMHSVVGERCIEVLVAHGAASELSLFEDYLMQPMADGTSSPTRLACFLQQKGGQFFCRAVFAALPLSGKVYDALLEMIDMKVLMEKHVAIVRSLIRACGELARKKRVKKLLTLIEQSVYGNEEEKNMWDLLEARFGYNGLCVAADILQCIDVKLIGSSLADDLYESVKSGYFSLPKAGTTKKGVQVLQQCLLKGTNSMRKVIRTGVLDNFRVLCFNPYGSFLVRDVAPHFSKRERRKMVEELVPIANKLAQSNFALYSELGVKDLLAKPTRFSK